MEDIQEQSVSGNKKPMSPLVSGVAGAVVGAGLAVATTKILSDKKMRGKIKDTFTSVSHTIAKSVSKAREKAMEMREAAEHKSKGR